MPGLGGTSAGGAEGCRNVSTQLVVQVAELYGMLNICSSRARLLQRTSAVVVSTLVVTSFAQGAAAQPRKKPSPSQQGDAELVIDSTKPGAEIGRITGHSHQVDFHQEYDPLGHRVVQVATVTNTWSWVKLCQAPCKVKVPTGPVALRLDGPGYPVTIEGFNFHPGVNHVVAKPGSSLVATAGFVGSVIGFSTAALAGVMWGLASKDRKDPDFKDEADGIIRVAMPATFIGLGAAAVGIGVWIAGSSSIDRGREPPVHDHARGVTVHGTF